MNLDLFRPREKFLILEITPKGTNGLFLSVDEDRNVIFEKMANGVPLAKLLKTPARRLSEKAWEGKKFWNGRRRVVAVADSSLATTIPIPLELAREHASVKNKINVAELENMIAQAMAKVFNGCRSEAARRLGTGDLDAILVGAKARHFKVDGKAFVNPAGVAGKKISLLLELTFATRQIFEDLKPFFNSPAEFFFAEAPQAHLQALSRARALPLNLIAADDAGASLYILLTPKGEHAVLYREKLNWSFSSLLSRMKDAFGVSDAAARKLYDLYRRGKVAEHAARAFKKIVAPAEEALFREMERGRVKGAVYLDMPQPLALRLPHKHGGATLEPHPVKELFAGLGFTLPQGAGPNGEAEGAAQRSLLYFLEAYFDQSGSEINQKLRRRLHWLAG